MLGIGPVIPAQGGDDILGRIPTTFRIACILLFFSLSGCFIQTGPDCIYADDFGQNIHANVEVDSQIAWVDSGINVGAGLPLQMTIQGLVDLCPNNYVVDMSIVSPNKPYWQTTSVMVNKGDNFTMAVSGSYRAGTGDGGGSSPIGRGFANGQGLFVFIAPHIPDPNQSQGGLGSGGPDFQDIQDESPSNPNGIYYLSDNRGGVFQPYNTDITYMSGWDGTNIQSAPQSPPYIFELSGNGTTPNGFTGVAPVTGEIFMKYANQPYFWPPQDYHGHPETVWGSDWHCSADFGALGCANYTQIGPYYNQSPQTAYTVSIDSGCIGQYGKYLSAVIVPSPSQVQDIQWASYISSSGVVGCLPSWYNEACKPLITSYPTGCTPTSSADTSCTQALAWVTPNNTACTPPNTASDTSCVINQTGSVYIPMQWPVVNGAVTTINLDPAAGIVSATGVYSGTVPSNGELWFYLLDNNVKPPQTLPTYTDNVGSYTVSVNTVKTASGFSHFVNAVINPVKSILFGDPTDPTNPGIAQGMFNAIVSAGNFIAAVSAAMTLYVVIYGMAFMLGMIKEEREDFIKNMIKLLIIAALIKPNAWGFFYNNFFSLFVNGIDQLISAISGQFVGNTFLSTASVDPLTGQSIIDPTTGSPVQFSVSDPFSFADQTMNRFFNSDTWIKLITLIFASPIGLFYFIIILVGMGFYIYALIKAVIVYLIALVALCFLLALSPIFITFWMFKKTKGYFEGWVKQLINFTLQPVLVVAAMAIFNVFVYSALFMVLHYDVCWDCLLEISIDTHIFGTIDLGCIMGYYSPQGSPKALGSMPMGFFIILIFLIITNAMLHMVDWMSKLGGQLSSGATQTSLAKAADAAMGRAAGYVGSKVMSQVGKIKNKLAENKDKKKEGGGEDKKQTTKR